MAESKPNQNQGGNRKPRYNYLFTPIELHFQHQEARRIHDSGELLAVTRAYYNLETSLIPVVGRDQMAELIELYRRRGDEALEKITKEEERLEQLIETNDALAAFDAETIDGAIEENQTRDGEVTTIPYQRSAGGQNRFLEVLQHFDRACCLVEILFLSNWMDPIQRYDCISELRRIVINLSRHVKKQHNKAIGLSEQQRKRRKEAQEESEAKSTSSDSPSSDGEKQEDGKGDAGPKEAPVLTSVEKTGESKATASKSKVTKAAKEDAKAPAKAKSTASAETADAANHG